MSIGDSEIAVANVGVVLIHHCGGVGLALRVASLGCCYALVS